MEDFVFSMFSKKMLHECVLRLTYFQYIYKAKTLLGFIRIYLTRGVPYFTILNQQLYIIYMTV